VKRREQRARRLLRERANRHAHVVVADHRRERMRRTVEPATLEVEAHVREQRATEFDLGTDPELATRRKRRVPLCPLSPLGAAPAEPAPERAQQRVETLATHLRLVLIEKAVVEIVAHAQRLRTLAHQRQEQRERLRERRKVVLLARTLPR